MGKNVTHLALSATLLALCVPTAAQQPTKRPHMRYIDSSGLFML
jgi:hypothetical protein